ncbi:MAG: hypothetical protein U0234_08290 [Sandaracinus sp.]
MARRARKSDRPAEIARPDPPETPADRLRRYAALERSARALGVTRRAAEAWLALGPEAWGSGHPAVAERAATRARRIAERLADPRLFARAAMERARVAFGASDWERARSETEAARDRVRGVDPALEAQAEIGLAAIGSHLLLAGASRHARRAIFLAEELGEPTLLARALAQLGIVLVERGVHAEGRAVLERALAIERGRRSGENECRALLYLAMLELDAGRPLQSLRQLRVAREVAQKRGSRAAQALVAGSIGVVHLVRGAPALAAEELVRADLLLEDLGNRHARITFLAFLGAAEALSPRPTEARAAFELAHALLADGPPAPYGTELVRVMEAVRALAEGSAPESVRRVLADVERGEVARHWADLRVGCGVLRRALLGEATTRVPRAEPTAGLLVGEGARWFSLEGAPPVDLERKPVLRRLLALLVATRQRAPGETLARSRLARSLWPEDARLSAHLLASRINVAVATLRRLGLRDAIATGHEGYRLREELPLVVDPG